MIDNYFPDYIANDCDDQLPVISSIGHGEKGMDANVSIKQQDDTTFILESTDDDGRQEWESENLHAGVISIKQQTPESFIMSLTRGGVVVFNEEIKLPVLPGTTTYIATSSKLPAPTQVFSYEELKPNLPESDWQGFVPPPSVWDGFMPPRLYDVVIYQERRNDHDIWLTIGYVVSSQEKEQNVIVRKVRSFEFNASEIKYNDEQTQFGIDTIQQAIEYLYEEIIESISKSLHFVGLVSLSSPQNFIKPGTLWIDLDHMPNIDEMPIACKKFTTDNEWVDADPYSPSTFDWWANKNDDLGYYWFADDWNINDYVADEETITITSSGHLALKDKGIRLKHLSDEVNEALADKVDKVDGKGLSTNDFTEVEKEKLAGVDRAINDEIEFVNIYQIDNTTVVFTTDRQLTDNDMAAFWNGTTGDDIADFEVTGDNPYTCVFEESLSGKWGCRIDEAFPTIKSAEYSYPDLTVIGINFTDVIGTKVNGNLYSDWEVIDDTHLVLHNPPYYQSQYIIELESQKGWTRPFTYKKPSLTGNYIGFTIQGTDTFHIPTNDKAIDFKQDYDWDIFVNGQFYGRYKGQITSSHNDIPIVIPSLGLTTMTIMIQPHDPEEIGWGFLFGGNAYPTPSEIENSARIIDVFKVAETARQYEEYGTSMYSFTNMFINTSITAIYANLFSYVNTPPGANIAYDNYAFSKTFANCPFLKHIYVPLTGRAAPYMQPYMSTAFSEMFANSGTDESVSEITIGSGQDHDLLFGMPLADIYNGNYSQGNKGAFIGDGWKYKYAGYNELPAGWNYEGQ
jgi:hypothetical protein